MQNALADLLGPVIQPVLEGEMSEHLGYGGQGLRRAGNYVPRQAAHLTIFRLTELYIKAKTQELYLAPESHKDLVIECLFTEKFLQTRSLLVL